MVHFMASRDGMHHSGCIIRFI